MTTKYSETELTLKNVTMFVGGDRVGCADVENNGDEIWLSNFGIYPRFRNKGYGTAFLKHLIRQYKVNTLFCAEGNQVAMSMYEKQGFRVVDMGETNMEGNGYLMKRGAELRRFENYNKIK